MGGVLAAARANKSGGGGGGTREWTRRTQNRVQGTNEKGKIGVLIYETARIC